MYYLLWVPLNLTTHRWTRVASELSERLVYLVFGGMYSVVLLVFCRHMVMDIDVDIVAC